MADQTLRTLARRYRETGTLTDEAAWLRAIVQGGHAGPAVIGQAAALGHLASRLLVNARLDVVPEFLALAEAIYRLGYEGSIRAAVAALHPVLAAGRALASEHDWVQRAERVVFALEAWLPQPDADNAYLPRAVAQDQFPRDLLLPARLCDPTRPHFELVQRAANLLPVPQQWIDEAGDADPEELALLVEYARSLGSQPLAQLLDQAAALASEHEVRQRIVDELVPWLYRTGDPVRSRLSRQQGAVASPASGSAE